MYFIFNLILASYGLMSVMVFIKLVIAFQLFSVIFGAKVDNIILWRRNCLKHLNSENAELSTSNKLHILVASLLALLLFFIILGLIKGLIGLFIWPPIGLLGLNILMDLPRPLHHYIEKDLIDTPVIYDSAGWPLHPDTFQKTVRILPKQTEFCLNTIFFMAFPLCLIVFLANLCCGIRNAEKNKKGVYFKSRGSTSDQDDISTQTLPGTCLYGEEEEENDAEYVKSMIMIQTENECNCEGGIDDENEPKWDHWDATIELSLQNE